MAAAGIKYDDGTGGFASTCFPVRGLLRQLEDGRELLYSCTFSQYFGAE